MDINTFVRIFMERKEELFELIVGHLNMTSLAVLLSLLIGVPVGLLITKNKKIASFVISVTNIMQSIPSIALLAFLVPFIGIGEKPAIIIVVVYSLLPIIKNTYTGITSIDPKVMEAAEGIGLSKWQQLFKVQIPMALPFIMAGVRISAVSAVGTVTISAFAGAKGLGWFINLGLNANEPNIVLLGAIPASIMALLVDYVLGKLEKAITPEGLKPADQIEKISKSKRRTRTVVALVMSFILFILPVMTSFAGKMHKEEKTVTVGCMAWTEGIIMGNLYAELIEENTDIHVEKRFNLNTTPLEFEALKNGSIDMFVDYTGFVSPIILHLPIETDTEKVYNDVVRLMREDHDVFVSKPLGFSNKYAFAMSPEASEKYGITKLSQLIDNASSIRFGGTTSFLNREDLLPKLINDYGVEFKSVDPIEGNIRYQAIKSNQIDVTDAYTTDAMTVKVKLVMLEDDIGFFPPYEAINIARNDVFEKYPELVDLLAKLDGAITTEEMAQMNYEVDVESKDPRQVARDFLAKEGLIKAN